MDPIEFYFIKPDTYPKSVNSFIPMYFKTNIGKFDDNYDCFLTLGPIVGMFNLQFNPRRLNYIIDYSLRDRDKIIEYLSLYTDKPVNICSEGFILNTGMYFLKMYEVSVKSEDMNIRYVQTDLNNYIEKEYEKIIRKLPNFKEDYVKKYKIMSVQPESFYLYFERKSYISDFFKIHISIKPEYTNNVYDYLFKFRETNETIFNKLFKKCKVQVPGPIHLYRHIEEWNSWSSFIKENSGGNGYIVLYPSGDYNKKTFARDVTIFMEWWIFNFEFKFPNAKRDAHYIPYNERISDTLYVAQGSDTASRNFARKNSRRSSEVIRRHPEYVFKESEKINRYIDHYCDLEEKGEDNSYIGECLKNSYGLDEINCSQRNCITDVNNPSKCRIEWPIDKVWNIRLIKYPNESYWTSMDNELGLSRCHIDEPLEEDYKLNRLDESYPYNLLDMESGEDDDMF